MDSSLHSSTESHNPYWKSVSLFSFTIFSSDRARLVPGKFVGDAQHFFSESLQRNKAEARRFVLFMRFTKARQSDIAPALLTRLTSQPAGDTDVGAEDD